MKHFILMIAVTIGLVKPEISRAAAPAVNNDSGVTNAATGVTQLRGTLVGAGGCVVDICWGTVDGGTDKAQWGKTITLTGVPSGAFSATVSNLVYGLAYYYRCHASGADGAAWAPATGRFTSQQPRRPADLPVTQGLALWLDASQLTGLSDGQQLEQWMDMSGQTNHAVRQNRSSPGYPRYAVNRINGLPAVQFNSADSMGDYLQFARISTIRTVFWVLNEHEYTSGGHFLLGDSIAYHFHRGDGRVLWNNLHSRPEIRKGTTRLMGTAVDGTTTRLPAVKYQLLSLVTAGNVQADQINQDRSFNGSWQGEIAEVLIYTNALSDKDEALVGGYLAAKYGLTTAYPAFPAYTSTTMITNSAATGPGADSVVLNAKMTCPGAVYGVSAYWGVEDAGTNAAKWGQSAYVGAWTNALAADVGKTIKGVKANTTYYFMFRATNDADDVWASNVMSFGPSPYKNILSFGTADLKDVVISGDNIIWTLPFHIDVTALAPTFTLSEWATCKPASGSARNFSTPQKYTVTAVNGSTRIYSVTIRRGPPRTEKNMLTFGYFPCCPALIFGTNIIWTVPHTEKIKSLAPIFTLSAGATCKPASGTTRDFSTPQTYAVTAEDGSRKNYVVTVAVADPPANKILTFGLPGMPAVIAGTRITWTVPHGTDVTSLAPVYMMSDLATGYPYPGTVRNFTAPQTYIVTADDGATQVYVVTVLQKDVVK